MENSSDVQSGAAIRPKVDFEDVKELAFSLYGLNISKIVELNGYDDRNYHITTEKRVDSVGDEFVLKIINLVDSKSPELFDAQTNLLIHLNENGIPCPRPIFTNNNLYFTKIKLSSGEHIVRLLEYIHGTLVYNVTPTVTLLHRLGEFVAKTDVALMDFSHDAYDEHKPFWMLESVPKIRQLIYVVTDPDRKKLVLDVIKHFEDRVLTVSNTLAGGLIHGDFNEQNIIVEREDDDWKVKAVIDFGDCHKACYLYEIAITMTYMMLQVKDIDAGGHVLAGYTSVRGLSEKEYSLLKICIASRLCQSLVLGAYTHLQDPSNSYVLTTAAYGWALLEKIWTESEENLLARWKKVADLH